MARMSVVLETVSPNDEDFVAAMKEIHVTAELAGKDEGSFNEYRYTGEEVNLKLFVEDWWGNDTGAEYVAVAQVSVVLDTTNLKAWDLQAAMKKDHIAAEVVREIGPGGGWSEVRYTADSAGTLEDFIMKFWCDEWLLELITNSNDPMTTPLSSTEEI